MSRFQTELAAALLLAVGMWGFLYWATGSTPHQTKTYNVMLLNSELTTSSWKATHITNNGFCTTLWRKRVVDTVICHPHLITEANGEEEPTSSQSKTGVTNGSF